MVDFEGRHLFLLCSSTTNPLQSPFGKGGSAKRRGIFALGGAVRHLLQVPNRLSARGPCAPQLPAPGLGPDRSTLARTCSSLVSPHHTPSGTARPQTAYSHTPRRFVCPC